MKCVLFTQHVGDSEEYILTGKVTFLNPLLFGFTIIKPHYYSRDSFDSAVI